MANLEQGLVPTKEREIVRDGGAAQCVLPGLGRAEYEAIPAINQSTLKLFELSALHAQHELLHPKDPTPAMHNSSAVHTALLEPEKFHREWVRCPTRNGKRVQKRSNADRQLWKEFEEEHAGQGILTPDIWQGCLDISKALWEGERPDCQLARTFLGGPGLNEATLVWSDKGTGIWCKGRPDRLVEIAGKSYVIDLKAVDRAERGAFARAIAKYGWHAQAAFYADGAYAVAPRERTFLWIAVEKEPPHGIGFYWLNQEGFEQGRNDYSKWLRAYAEAASTNVWSGYAAEIQQVELPKWALKYEEWEA
jgi:exodeoxyribonuclease VIII